PLAEQRHRRVDLRDVDQDPLSQRDVPPGGNVCLERDLVGRPGGEVVEDGLRQELLRPPCELRRRQRQRLCHCRIPTSSQNRRSHSKCSSSVEAPDQIVETQKWVKPLSKYHW